MRNGICYKRCYPNANGTLEGADGPPSRDLRRTINGILYLNKTGCQWRMIPPELGNWSTIYGYFKRWRCDGVWASLMETLRQWERCCEGRKPEPSAGRIDSQSIKTTTQNEDIGFGGSSVFGIE